MRFILATRNAGKLREAETLFASRGLLITGLPDTGDGLSGSPPLPEPEETGTTFAENAAIKARGFAEALRVRGLLPADTAVVAEDSGLCVDALGGRPGVYSARFMGEATPYAEKNAWILSQLKNAAPETRTARFKCAAVCWLPDGGELTACGVLEGVIAEAPRGENGFGYDPVFLLPERGLTVAELALSEKNAVSHRGRAFSALLEQLQPFCRK